MSDLISRQDAVSEIDEWIQMATGNGTDMAIKDFLSFLKERIESLPSAEPKTGWIPVSERLPEKDGSYLVCMNWDYRNMDVLMWADGWNCIRLINDKVDRKSEIDGEKITAWMPLPIPYREEGE